jgi:hypothetical protein
MNKLELSSTWLFDPIIDFEYKTYLILNFEQKVRSYYNQYKLYPALTEVVYHTKNIESYLSIEEIINRKDKPLTKKQIALIKTTEKYSEDSYERKDINKISKWSLPILKELSKDGVMLYKSIDHCIKTNYMKVGDGKKGHILVTYEGSDVTEVYKYIYKSNNKKEGHKHVEPDYDFVSYDRISVSDIINKVVCDEWPSILMVDSKAFPTIESVLPIACRRMSTHWI